MNPINYTETLNKLNILMQDIESETITLEVLQLKLEEANDLIVFCEKAFRGIEEKIHKNE